MVELVPGTQVVTRDEPQRRIRHLLIEVRRGPERGRRIELRADPVLVGSAVGCDLQLADPTVSGVHAEMQRTDHGLLVRDRGSTNGTFVDGHRIEAVYVASKATVRLGETELRLQLLDESSERELADEDRFGDLLGCSVPMRAVFAQLRRLVATDTTGLISGETGTGKELAAAALYEQGPRRAAPFVVVDCGAMPAGLIESELLGHERGSFTGAERRQAGAFERAHGGTLFLDEIGELPLALQPALLGVLERRETRRLGGSAPISVDVRVIAATNRDLAGEVSRGAFRADLYYRLAVVELRLPALRERPDDVVQLTEYFLAEHGAPPDSVSPEMMAQLQKHPWPGNVRELRNVLARAVLMSEPPRPADAPRAATTTVASTASAPDIDRPFKEQKQELIARFETAYVEALLRATDGNIAAAARRADIDRMYLYKLLARTRDK
ncbi:MAG: sigma 54-interacting transcriptional regulator [Myxococcota bacterium]